MQSDARLVLSNGVQLSGRAFGARRVSSGELVFTTGLAGYCETLTDPSYFGQILTFSYPLIGNYGVPNFRSLDLLSQNGAFESNRVQVSGVVLSSVCDQGSHWMSHHSFHDWMEASDVPGIMDIDTRSLVQSIRENGLLFGRIVQNEVIEDFANASFYNPSSENVIQKVSTPYIRKIGSGKSRIGFIDCGAKWSIVRELVKRGCEVEIIPWDADFESIDCTAWVLSNGPGDPTQTGDLKDRVAKLLHRNQPVFGICLGFQILALAANGATKKMSYGHRSHNQPIIDLATQRAYLTSQNHGYVVDETSLSEEWQIWFKNLNDNTVEGIKHVSKNISGVQFHPEAAAGPHDTKWILDSFVNSVHSSNKYFDFHPSKPVPVEQKNRIKKILLLGSGGLTIGQAGEFDYSGTQAIKALVEEGIKVVLVNPNVATVQTNPQDGVEVYLYPVSPFWVKKVIEKEKPDGIIGGFGGQTALNCLISLEKDGVLKEFQVQNYGTSIHSLCESEDRAIFTTKMRDIGIPTSKNMACNTVEEALKAGETLGFPIILRSAYTLGGLGSGVANNKEELENLAKDALKHSFQVLLEGSLYGWKEIEYEIIRDTYGHCLTICNMENIDPLGIHTGDSIVITPTQTLNDNEVHILRNASLAIADALKIVGACNVQFALDPKSLRFVVIEVNARLSRSSALASKASGYPIAYIATKLVLGKNLIDLKNPTTGITSAFYEPALDYVTVKIPKWEFEKFPGTSRHLGTAMKSIGEVMGIGRSFPEALQKAVRMVLENDLGISSPRDLSRDKKTILEKLNIPTDERIFTILQAFRLDISVEEVHAKTAIDPWFLNHMKSIVDVEDEISTIAEKNPSFDMDFNKIPHNKWSLYKRSGFSDMQLAYILNEKANPTVSRLEIKDLAKKIRAHRIQLGVVPYFKRIDTTAAEYPSSSNYLYATYHASTNDSIAHSTDTSVIVLGGGPYHIGSSIEFDWCAVSCSESLRKNGVRSITINCNPETVSTDFNMSDCLYFEEMSVERILDIGQFEQTDKIIVSMGGQSPNNLSKDLELAHFELLGNSAKTIDLAENRPVFSDLIDRIQLDQPRWSSVNSREECIAFVELVGLPVIVRPSFVLSGRKMRIIFNNDSLNAFLEEYDTSWNEHALVVSEFLHNAIEVEVDGIAHNNKIILSVVSEHIEYAGVHSGDATISVQTLRLSENELLAIEEASKKISQALSLNGPFNIQYLVRDAKAYVIECNARSARSFPFISKATGVNLAALATDFMLKKDMKVPIAIEKRPIHAIKASTFSFHRLKGSDPVCGVEMRSTGEIASIDRNFHNAYLIAMEASHICMPSKGVLIWMMGNAELENHAIHIAKILNTLDIPVYTPVELHRILEGHKLASIPVSSGESLDSIFDLFSNGRIDFVCSVPDHHSVITVSNEIYLRTLAVQFGISLLTESMKIKFYFDSLTEFKRNESNIEPFALSPWIKDKANSKTLNRKIPDSGIGHSSLIY